MTTFHDLFVGVVAILVGCFLVAGAAVESPMLMGLAKSQRLAEALGKTAARWIIGAAGGVSILIGVLIASGWRVRW